MENKSVIPGEVIENKIASFRGHKVMLDSDLAELYGVQTKVLNQAVRRNIERFPDDFMFQLTPEESEILKTFGSEVLRSQFVTLNGRGRHRKYRPYVFTEQGVAMLSSVLKSKRAVSVNIEIMRAFVRLRELMSSNIELSRRLDELEKKYDGHFKVVFDAIRQLMIKPEKSRGKIGFHRED